MNNYRKLLRNLALNYVLKTQDTSIAAMKTAAYPVIIVPFNGDKIAVTVRCLNEIQLRSCGAFGIFEFMRKKLEEESTEFSNEEIAEICDIQERVLRETLYSPSYDEIITKIYGSDEHIKAISAEVVELEKKVRELNTSTKIEEKLGLQDLRRRLKTIKMSTGFLLPADFSAAIVQWAIAIDRSDVKKVSKSMLLTAGALSEKTKSRPSEFIQGEFSDFHKTEIDSAAIVVYTEYLRDQREIEKATQEGKTFHAFNRDK